ncbi:MarR family winged helix-turn-helix transcriptional regulator [Streptomyces abikoensis]
MTTTTAPQPANPAVPDDFASLAAQPIGYWSWVVHEAVIRHIRGAMARTDITQPQWWILNQVDGAGGDGLAPELLRERLGSVLGTTGDEIRLATDSLLARGWLAAGDTGLLRLTEAGQEAKARTKELVTRLRAEIHEGIGDEEYVAALRVLKRMIDNVGGENSVLS